MQTEFQYNIREQIIVLSHLENKKFLKGKTFSLLHWSQPKKKRKNKRKVGYKKGEEILEEIEKEKSELSKLSKQKYYKLEEEKKLELEKIFVSSKLKVYLSDPQILGKGKMYSISEKVFKIYESFTFIKLYEIPFENTKQIRAVIELDNNDLAFFMAIEKPNNYYYEYQLHIYRLKDKKYFLFQIIKEDRAGFFNQYSGYGCDIKKFELLKIKALSNNRILSLSNYGIRIYSLNSKENNYYSLILIDAHIKGNIEGIEEIYEFNHKNLLFCINILINSKKFFLIEKLEIKNIKECSVENKEKEPKIKKMKESNESKDIISSLQLRPFYKKLFGNYFCEAYSYHFSSCVILKNKYFIIMINYHILIFNLLTGEQMIRYSIVQEGDTNLFVDNEMKIGKWNCDTDNEFYIIIKGNITLFELDDFKEINLKIIAYTYFRNQANLNELDDNKFYIKNTNNIIIYSK